MSPARESTLPAKEKQHFHKLVKCYEQKQFKQGLKYAKQILSNPKCSDHGETLSMKGLILSAMNRKEEALDLARKGLKNDFRSGTCWHVYGLILRAEKKYDEAIKAYSNALKWENTNQLILKDLSHLQIQMRDLEGFKKSRLEMLSLRPTLRASWIGYGIANHLLDERDTAFAILDEFRKTNQATEKAQKKTSKDAENDYEASELLLYQAKILSEGNQKEEALVFLIDNESDILDKVARLEALSQLCLETGKLSQAEKYLTQLIHRNPEKAQYYHMLADCVGASTDQNRLLEFYEVMQSTFPRAKLPRVLPLQSLTGDVFNQTLRRYLKDSFRKCLPNIHVTLRPLYSNVDKLAELQAVSLEFLSKMEATGAMEDGDDPESPGCLVWLYHFLAQHFDYLGNFDDALRYVDLGLAHTPTLIELYVAKGRIFKHAGHIDYAVACLDEAQSLDTADRYLNCKCCAYLIRAGEIERAEKMAAQFTRENTTVQENLKEMQVLWFQIECAETYFRQGKYGLALRKCYEIENVFADITEDQFDFHQYCMRKMTLSKYVDMLRLEDQLREHRFFRCAAVIAIEIYIQIFDGVWNPDTGKSGSEEAKLSESELKKLKNKQKREKAKKEAQKKQGNKESNKKNEPIKEDPLEPEKLLNEAKDNSIEKAKEWSKWLEELSPEWLEGQALCYEVAKRRRKWLQQIRALKRCIAHHGATHPRVHPLVCDWLTSAKTAISESSESPIVKQILVEETEKIEEIVKEKCPIELNQKFLTENIESYPHRLSAAKIESQLSKSHSKVSEIIRAGSFEKGSIEDFQAGLDLLKSGKIESGFLLEKAQEKYPLATAFGAKKDQESDKFVYRLKIKLN